MTKKYYQLAIFDSYFARFLGELCEDISASLLS